MAIQMDKQALFKKIEEKRGSKLISYFISDKQGPFNGRVAKDVIPFVSAQLRKIGKVPKIDLFLYSAGGDTLVPWRLVSMIREYCDEFNVLIPYKAHSAASMISLGADHIVMSDLSELSPIDPSTTNFFNPIDPVNPQNKIPISVEEVVAYFDLAKNKFGIKSDEDLTKVFNKFMESSPHIHPLALGNVNRTHNLIRLLARRLLKSHKEQLRDTELEKVIKYFTEELYSHEYVVGRKEAKEELGLNFVENADGEVATLMTDLYDIYAKEIGLADQWNPEIIMGQSSGPVKKDFKVAFLEQSDFQFFWISFS